MRQLSGRDFNRFYSLAEMRMADGQTQGSRISTDVPVFPEGEVVHPEYGDLDFSRKQLESYARHFDDKVRKIDMAVDIDHKNEKAVGWVKRLYYRPGSDLSYDPGLYAEVEWNRLGQRLLADKQYKYISPQFGEYTDERTGEKFEKVLIALTITNFPFLKDMPAIKLAELAWPGAAGAAKPAAKAAGKPAVGGKPAPGAQHGPPPPRSPQGKGTAAGQPQGSGFDTTPLSQLDLQNLPRGSFLVQGMPDDPRTWKLPVADASGTPNLHAIMAAHAVAHGAGGTSAPQVSQEIHDQLHTQIATHEKASAEELDAAQNPQAADQSGAAKKRFTEVRTHRQRLADGERILRGLSLKDKKKYMKATRAEFIKNQTGGDTMARAKRADDDDASKAKRAKKADDDDASKAKRADDDELDEDNDASELDDDADASELDDDELDEDEASKADDDGDTLKKGRRAKKAVKAKRADDDNDASKAKKAYDEDEAWDKSDMQPFEKNSKQEIRRVPSASPPSGPGKNLSEMTARLAENIRHTRALEMRLRERDVTDATRKLSETFRLTVDGKEDADGEPEFVGKFSFAKPVLNAFKRHAMQSAEVGAALSEVLGMIRKDGIIDLSEHGRNSDPEDAENDILKTVTDVSVDRKFSDKYAVEGANHMRLAQAYAKANGLDWKKGDDQLVAFDMTDPRKSGRSSGDGYARAKEGR